jgi:hypothetical protein
VAGGNLQHALISSQEASSGLVLQAQHPLQSVADQKWQDELALHVRQARQIDLFFQHNLLAATLDS